VALQQSLVIRDLAERARRGDFTWHPYFPGVEIHRLYGDESAGPSAILLRYQPGARAPHHTHPGHEHIYVLTGEQSDERGTYPVGTLVVNPPGSQHDVQSATGCVVLVIKEQPVVFTATPPR
jgi:anti-sigma factor ChrR (cupin superfamily)